MPRSRCLPTVLSLLAALGATPVLADEGLKLPGAAGWMAWPSTLRFQATLHETLPLSLSTLTPAQPADRATGLALFGDYYLFGLPDEPGAGWASGLRASSGLLIRQSGVSLADLARASRAQAAGAPPLRLPPLGPGGLAAAEPAGDGYASLPYLGLGYSGQIARSGWGFWADVGMVVQSPGGALGLGRVIGGNQGVDDLIRELRLSPMLQLGISYAF
jgi:hypothetical protein